MRRTPIFLLSLGALIGSQPVFAVGTTAGTDIANSAQVEYEVAALQQEVPTKVYGDNVIRHLSTPPRPTTPRPAPGPACGRPPRTRPASPPRPCAS